MKSIRDSIVKQQRESKDLGQYRKQRLFKNICNKNLAGEQNIQTSQQEGHQLYDAHLIKMKSVKHKTIEDVQKERANPNGIDRKKIRKANILLKEVDRKEQKLLEGQQLKQQVINKNPVDKYGALENQFFYDSLEIRSLNEFMFFYDLLKRIKAEKQHEEQRNLFKAKLQKIWELETQANNRINSSANISVKHDTQNSRIQSASTLNSKFINSLNNESSQLAINRDNIQGLQIVSPQAELAHLYSPSSGLVTGSTDPGTASKPVRPSSGKINIGQRVVQLKQREQLLKAQLDDTYKMNGNKIDQKVGPDEPQILSPTKNKKIIKDMFSGTSKFMTMKQADIQLVELIEKIRRKTKTKEKKDQTQNLIVPGMKKGFNAQDINNVVDTAIERAERSKFIQSASSFSVLEQNHLKVPIYNKLQRHTDNIRRDRENIITNKRNGTDMITPHHNYFEREYESNSSEQQIKSFKISSGKSTLKIGEGKRHQSPHQYAMSINDENIKIHTEGYEEIEYSHKEKLLTEPVTLEEKTSEINIRKRSLILASGLISKEAPKILLTNSQNELNPTILTKQQSSKENKNVKISFQIPKSKEQEDQLHDTHQMVNSKKSDILDNSIGKLNFSQPLDTKVAQNLFESQSLKLSYNINNADQVCEDDISNFKVLDLDVKRNISERITNFSPQRDSSRLRTNNHGLQQTQQQQNKKQRGLKSSLDNFDNINQNQNNSSDVPKITLSLDRKKQQKSLPDFEESNFSPARLSEKSMSKVKLPHSQSSHLYIPNQSPVIKASSFKDLSMTFTKKEIDKFDIEKRILENLDKIGKQLRIQKKVNLPQKLQNKSRLRPQTAKAQQEKNPFKFSPQFISNWVDLRSKIEQKYNIPSQFQVHKILNQKIKEIKHQKQYLQTDNSFYVYVPEQNDYYL